MLERLFHLNEHNTDVRTEIFAGITTFMTMSYILVANPQILSQTGMDIFSVFTATALGACIATLLMAFVANLPVALAPGMDLNVLFAFIVVRQMGYSWQFALTAVFITGILFFLLSFTKFRDSVVKCFPQPLKYAISAGIGLFITFIGVQSSGLVVDGSNVLVKLGDINSASSLLTISGVFIIGTMLIYKIKGALLIGVLAVTMLGIPFGVTHFSSFSTPELFSAPSLAPTFMQFEWQHVLTYDMFIVVVLFLFADVLGTAGTLIGLGVRGEWINNEETLPKSNKALMVDAFSTSFGAVLGTSSITSYVESASGIVQGGRTGLTSLTVAVLFFLSLFFAPIFLLVPPQATAAALIMVGVFMIAPITRIDFNDYLYAIPAFTVVVTMPLTYNIADGIVFGLVSFVILAFISGRREEVTPLAIGITLVSLLKYCFID